MNTKQTIKKMLNQLKQDKEQFFFFLIFIGTAITLLCNVVWIGSTLNENSEILRIVISIIVIIEILYQKITKKQNYRIIQNKLDICLLLFVISTSMSLFLKKYVSLYAEINNILKYLSAFGLYLVVRDLIHYNEKYKKRMLHIIVIAGVCTAIIGIDDLTTKYFTNILQNAGNLNVYNQENRMFGAFSYANVFAIVMAMAFLIAISNYLEESNQIIKKMYIPVIFILGSTLVLSYSRMVFVLMAIFLIIFFILIKKRKNKIEFSKLILFTGIASLIYNIVFSQVLVNKNYLLLWGVTIIETIALILAMKYTKKIDEYIEKVNLKTILLISAILLLIIMAFIIIGLQLTSPLCLFENQNSDQTYEYRLKGIEQNTTYNMKFDIEAISNIEDNYELNIYEQNSAFNTVKEQRYLIGNFTGIKEIEFETSGEGFQIVIQIVNKNNQENQSFKINEFKVNEEIVPLNYKYLPIKLVNKIKEIQITDTSVSSRFMYMKDAIKLILKNPIIGYGGEAFNYLHKTIQDSYYSTAEVHSFPLQIFLENGILGILTYIAIIIYIIKYIIQKKEKTILEIGIILALGILIMHSAMDFDMSYVYVVLDFFILLACIAPKKEQNKVLKNTNLILDIIIIIAMCVNVYGNTKFKSYLPANRWQNLLSKILKEDDLVDQMLKFRKEEKYYSYQDQISTIAIFIENEMKRENFSHVEELCEIIEEIYYPLDVSANLQKMNMAKQVINICDQYYETNKNEKYQEIKQRMKQYIDTRGLELEELWRDNTTMFWTEEQKKEIIKQVQEIRESV